MIGLVFLARNGEGMDALRRFAFSYLAHKPGIPHQLIIILKGYENDDNGEAEVRSFFDQFRPLYTRVSDEYYDISAYLLAAQQHQNNETFCFLNTHTVIAADNWLELLYGPLTLPNVGLVGSSGSYESLYSSVKLRAKVEWLTAHHKVPFDAQMARYIGLMLQDRGRDWLVPQNDRRLRMEHGHYYANALEPEWREFWATISGPGGEHHYLQNFDPFPQPHIRSNGFMIRRDEFIKWFSEIEPSKIDADYFESGKQGLTAQLKASGQRALVVDRFGKTYEEDAWPQSKTFRHGDQLGLLLTDNQTRAFDKMSEFERQTYALITWGDAAVEFSYNLGLRFSTNGAISESPFHIIDHLEYGTPHRFKNDHCPVFGHEQHCWPPS